MSKLSPEDNMWLEFIDHFYVFKSEKHTINTLTNGGFSKNIIDEVVKRQREAKIKEQSK